MTWGMVAVAGASLVGGGIAASGSRKAAKTSAQAGLGAAAGNEALLREGYESARRTLSPYIASSAAANRQLMAELGLSPQYEAEQRAARTSNVANLQQQLAALREAQASQTTAVQTQKKKSKGLKGALRKATGADSFKDIINPIGGTLAGHNLSKYLLTGQSNIDKIAPEDYGSAIADLEQQIADEEAGMAAIPQAAQQGPAYQPGTAYMRTPAYEAAREAGIGAVNVGASNEGALYSGARGVALRDVGQGVQQSFYNNYMNMLQNIASPATATNLSNIGIGTAGNIGSSNMASVNQANNYRMMGQEAQNAAIADITGGLTSAAGAYFNRPTSAPAKIPYTGDINISPTARVTA